MQLQFLSKIFPSLVVNPTRVRIQLWLEIPPGSGWIFTHGRIFTRGKELAVTLVVFSTAWLVFLPDTLVGPDVTVPGDDQRERREPGSTN